jgi:hypothetical protein
MTQAMATAHTKLRFRHVVLAGWIEKSPKITYGFSHRLEMHSAQNEKLCAKMMMSPIIPIVDGFNLTNSDNKTMHQPAR